MDRKELLVCIILLAIILAGLGVRSLRHEPQVEVRVVEGNPGQTTSNSPVTQRPSSFSPKDPLALPDINQATLVDLDKVPGIGPSLAQNILRYRDSHGFFRSMNDLDDVPGIGPSRLEKLKEYFCVPEEDEIAGFSQDGNITQDIDRTLSLAKLTPEPGYGRLDLNTATNKQLQTLPGIGEVLASSILEYRKMHGGFSSVEELLNVPGIGAKRFAQIAGSVSVGTETPDRIAPTGNPAQSAQSDSTERMDFDKFNTGSSSAGKVDLNRASLKELESLPGVGPVLAKRIVEYRQFHQGFRSPEELKNVSGIGDKKYAQIRPHVEVSR